MNAKGPRYFLWLEE